MEKFFLSFLTATSIVAVTLICIIIVPNILNHAYWYMWAIIYLIFIFIFILTFLIYVI